jgi:hypothetical protein
MIELTALQEELQDLNALIAKHERTLASHPEAKSLRANIQTLKRRRQSLEDDFLEAAAKVEIDVCSYRIIPGESRPTIMALSKALSDFQSLFSLTYDALKEGPKRIAKLSAYVMSETFFGFAYSFTGSIGFVMTLPNERLLLGETYLDQAMQMIFQMAKATTSQQIADFAKRLGPPPVRAIYKWATDHVESGLGVDIEWRRREQVRSSLFIQAPQLEQLREVIAETSDEKEEELEVVGNLIGADVKRKTFHLETVGGGEIKGVFVDAISTEQTVELPKPYNARVRKRTKIVYSMEEEKTEYFLLRLKALS